MHTIRFFVAAVTVAALPLLAGPAAAQANRTFVSGSGSDANLCTLSAPCRSFAQALAQTNAGGEITILDPAGYGPVVINKAVSIVNDGVGEAGITVTSATDGIIVAIGAGGVVNLRGLTLVGGGVGSAGILLNSSSALNIQNCVIRDFVGQGILVQAANATLNVSDTIVSNSGIAALEIIPEASGVVTAVYTRVQAIDSGIGFFVNGLFAPAVINATIANSTASNNQTGLLVESTTGQANSQLMVVNSVLSNNGTGVAEDGANSTTYLARNTISGNTKAFSVTNSGALFSFGDNDVRSNANDGGAIPLVSTK